MIPLMKNAFYNEPELRKKLAEFVLTSPTFSMGPQVKQYEEAFAAWQGRKHAIMVNSGSSANILLLQSLKNMGKLKDGDRVGVSALTWATNVMPVLQLGLKPVLLDVSMNTLNVQPSELIGKRLKVLFITHLLGLTDDIATITQYCKDNKIMLLEDNCESLGSVAFGKKLGNWGLASTFSFFVAHHLSTIEGGMVCTDDDKLADMLLMTRAHGWARSLSNEKRLALKTKHNIGDFYEKYTSYECGFNFRPTEINGFLGNQQLPDLETMIARRQSIFHSLYSAFNFEKMEQLHFSNMDVISSYGMPIVYKTEELANEARAKISETIEIRPLFSGDIGRQPFYPKHKLGYTNAHRIHVCGLFIGICPEYTDDEVNQIILAIKS
jgi:CDP-6-deoxy-D-xylo-4-hexulose-3-dehydrase